jgi:hypothetical protein
MKRIFMVPAMVAILLAVTCTWPAGEALAGQWQGAPAQHLAQGGQTVKGYFKSFDTRGLKWSVKVKPLGQKQTRTYPLAADISLTYQGESIPWQQGIVIDSIVELLMEKGEVKVINVIAWSS